MVAIKHSSIPLAVILKGSGRNIKREFASKQRQGGGQPRGGTSPPPSQTPGGDGHQSLTHHQFFPPIPTQFQRLFFSDFIQVFIGNDTRRPPSRLEGTTTRTPLGHHDWQPSGGGAARDLPKLGASSRTSTISTIRRHPPLPAVHSNHRGAASVFSPQTN